jgi:hypothetical protein
MQVEYEGQIYDFPEDTNDEVIFSFLLQNNKEYPEENQNQPTVDEEPLSQEPEFVDRINNPENYPVIDNPDGSFSTHRMAAEVDEKGDWYVFPTIQMEGGKLNQYNDVRDALNNAKRTGNFIGFPNKQSALSYADSYKYNTKLPAFSMRKSIKNHKYYNEDYLSALSMIESTNNPNAVSTSGAVGLYQFLSKTWRNTAKAYTPELYKSYSDDRLQMLRKDPEISKYMADMLTRENAANLQKRGADTSGGSLYLAHFLGVGEASNVLTSTPNTPIEKVVSDKARKNNPNVFRNIKTTGDLIHWSSSKVKQYAPKL